MNKFNVNPKHSPIAIEGGAPIKTISHKVKLGASLFGNTMPPESL